MTASAPRVDDVFVLPEPDYRYGVGPIVARILTVVGPVEYRGERWWSVTADVANGTPDNHGGWSHRGLYLREATFPQTRQVPIV